MTTAAQFEEVTLRGTITFFVLSAAVFLGLFLLYPTISDTDSYYHLAVAREYAANGVVDRLPWIEYGLLADHFADKELLFHLVLAPFAANGISTLGGRVALSILNAMLATIMGVIAVRLLGGEGWIVPIWVWVTSASFFTRVVRLRPELGALLLLLLAVWYASRRRYVLVGVLGGLFALAYTAFHLYLGLCAIWAAALAFKGGRRSEVAALFGYPVIAAVLALSLHPHFPDNLLVWKVQNIDFFLWKDRLDVGTEIFAPSLFTVLFNSAGWWVGVLAIPFVTRRVRESEGWESEPARLSLFLSISAAIFTAMFLSMGRMATYFIPFATLAVLAETRRRGRSIDLGSRRRMVAILALIAAIAFAALMPISRMRGGSSLSNRNIQAVAGSWFGRWSLNLVFIGSKVDPETDWRTVGSLIPDGARVMANWDDADLLCWWAPQGRYPNLLDPVFLASFDSSRYLAMRRALTGFESDPVSVLRDAFGSDYVAFAPSRGEPRFVSKLEADPRAQVLHRGSLILVRIDR